MNTQISGFKERKADVSRNTRETEIVVRVNLDGNGHYENHTGIGFLDHMLDLFARHGRFDLETRCKGDLHVDEHHTIEDVGIALGQAFRQALGDKKFIGRYGHAYVPMDDCLARCVVDLSGRFFLHFDACFKREFAGQFPTEMVHHFWYAFAEHLQCNLHLEILHGENTHHQIEALFKSAGRALRVAVDRDEAFGEVASTKGSL